MPKVTTLAPRLAAGSGRVFRVGGLGFNPIAYVGVGDPSQGTYTWAVAGLGVVVGSTVVPAIVEACDDNGNDDRVINDDTLENPMSDRDADHVHALEGPPDRPVVTRQTCRIVRPALLARHPCPINWISGVNR